mmetsp:Transcript_23400/g.28617  ORF Transcript_23400/g.28617 Transcript_23400/m.28617 type:complete len:165 (+) Transcript_23400:111-605(+)
MTTNHRHHHLQLKSREDGFDLDFGVRAKLPEYNALRDVNMKHYFENADRQEYLWRTGQIDRTGRVIADSTKNESKRRIIDSEFRRAEKMEQNLRRDEEEIRYKVRLALKREIETKRTAERVRRMKVERTLRRDILSVERGWSLLEDGETTKRTVGKGTKMTKRK